MRTGQKAGSGAGYENDNPITYVKFLIGFQIGLINIFLIKFQIFF